MIITPMFLTSIIMVIVASLILASTNREYFYNSNVRQDLVFDGGNNWTIQTPDNNTHAMYIVPATRYGATTWNPTNQVQINAADGRVVVNRIQLGNKFLLSGIRDHIGDDTWLRLSNIQNTSFSGGFAAGELWASRGSLSGSDRNLKKNIATISGDVSEKVMDLVPCSYVYKSEPESKRFGFIAQDVEIALPELVTTGPDGIKGVRYDDIIALLVDQVKKMRKEIAELKAKVGGL